MKPYQFKMATGAIYMGFPGPIDQYGMFQLLGACSATFISSESRYDMRGIFTSTEPLELNLACVQSRQICHDNTDSTINYCRYLGALIAAMEEEEVAIPSTFTTYIDHINPYFIEEFEGVDVLLAGKYDYAVIYGTQDADTIRLKMEKISREYHRNCLGYAEEKPCSDNVVAVKFGSNKNAPEKG